MTAGRRPPRRRTRAHPGGDSNKLPVDMAAVADALHVPVVRERLALGHHRRGAVDSRRRRAAGQLAAAGQSPAQGDAHLLGHVQLGHRFRDGAVHVDRDFEGYREELAVPAAARTGWSSRPTCSRRCCWCRRPWCGSCSRLADAHRHRHPAPCHGVRSQRAGHDALPGARRAPLSDAGGADIRARLLHVLVSAASRARLRAPGRPSCSSMVSGCRPALTLGRAGGIVTAGGPAACALGGGGRAGLTRRRRRCG